jgi:hypothetical protein
MPGLTPALAFDLLSEFKKGYNSQFCCVDVDVELGTEGVFRMERLQTDPK